jgi:hypothetical protein
MPWSALLVLGGLILGAAWHIDTTAALLPDAVATHFVGDGRPNGWMTREGYRVFMLLFVTVLPLFVVAMAGWLPRLFPGAANIPNRRHWMAPERREAALRLLAAYACWLGSLLVLFIFGIHILLLQANRSVPARLPETAFFGLLGGFALALLAWIVIRVRRFRRVD